MSTRVPSSPTGPGPLYDARWMYWFWDWVRANRAGYAGTGIIFTGDALGTLVPGTSTLSLSTTGVGAGTYGTGATWPRFSVDVKGRITTATAGGTLGTFAGFNTLVGAGDLLGTTTTSTFTGVLSTTGVSTGTYGAPTIIPRFDVNAAGRIVNATNAGTLGTFGGFNSLVGAGDLLGTTTTSTFTGALSTTGVAAGTYGTGGTMVSQITVDAAGRVTVASNVGISFPAGGGGTSTATFVGDALGTGTIPGGAISLGLSTTGVTAGTYGGTAGFSRFDISAAGRMISASNVLVEVQDPILLTQAAGTSQFSHNTSGVTAGTYGTGGTMVSQVTVNALGHVTAVSNVGINFPAGAGGTSTATFTGAVVGTGTIPGGPTGFTFNPNPNFTGTGTAAGWLTTGTSTAAMIQVGTATGAFARWGTSSAGLVQGADAAFVGTGTSVGWLAAIGSSASRSNVGVSAFVLATTVSLTTVAGTLMNYNMPASAIMGSGQGFRWSMWGTAQAGIANARRFGLTFGTATLHLATGTAATVTQWRNEGELIQVTANIQNYRSNWFYGASDASPTMQQVIGTLGMNLSTATPLNIQGTGTTAAQLRSQLGMMLNFFGRQ